jgi:para-nitrobenzyl esterase
MRPILLLALLVLSVSSAHPAQLAQAGERPRAKTAGGELEGVNVDGVRVFRGIPFAAPPVGELRWQPPRPPASWNGVRQAETYGAACPQPAREDGGGVGRMPVQSEDCLTLNVWAPERATPTTPLPVMVWIHGGAHRLGSGIAALYDGSELAKQGVVVVTLNYRLGLLGFFAHPAVTAAAAPDEPLGNYGILDQIAALEWVRTNIGAFGGDARNVTVFGESAGAADILYLLTIPRAKGLFAKAIVESGGGLQRPLDLAGQERKGLEYAAAIGLAAEASLDELRAKTPEDWIAAQGGLRGGLGFGPFVDGRLVKEPPWVAFRDDRAHDVPLIVGANSNEASVLTTLGVSPAALELAAGERLAELRAAYGEDTPEEEFRRQAMGDAVFVAPSRWLAEQAADGAPSYLYYFSYVASRRRGTVPGAAHGSEIPYVFKTWSGTALARLLDDQDRQMSDTMSACWVAFAKQGAPSCAGAPRWPAYTAENDLQMEFGEQISVRQIERAAAFDLLVEQFLKTAAHPR